GGGHSSPSISSPGGASRALHAVLTGEPQPPLAEGAATRRAGDRGARCDRAGGFSRQPLCPRRMLTCEGPLMLGLGGAGRRPRRSRAWSGLVVALALQAGPARSQAPPPNIVLLQSDDHGWPYYGFMQRYLRAKVGVGELIAHPAGSTGYDDPAIVLPE